MEPFTYPLLFNRGEPGWSSDLKIQMPDYIASKLLRIEEDFEMNSHLYPNTYMIRTNRLQAMARLGQVWMVDCVSRMVDRKLNWV
jgi:hypothetical protein